MGRATQGVRLINLKDEDAIASVAKVAVDEESEDFEGELPADEVNGDME
jgi:DNA gyrase subunit A